jgi:hypothetical protein
MVFQLRAEITALIPKKKTFRLFYDKIGGKILAAMAFVAETKLN